MECFNRGTISLDEPRDIYYSGQIVSGIVKFCLSQPLPISAIKVQFIGEANVSWAEDETEKVNGHEGAFEVPYQAKEEYFNHIQILAGGNGITTLPEGNHAIPFQCQIPHQAPSSFDGERGSVTYSIIAYMEHADPRVNREEIVKQFDVVAPLDLNTVDPELQIAPKFEFEDVNASTCCISNVVNIKITAPYFGYCPGQKIAFHVTADKRIEVRKFKFQLLRKECYRSYEPESEYIRQEVLSTIRVGPVLVGEMTAQLTVPEAIAVNMDNCNIIDVGYFLKVKIKMPGFGSTYEDEHEICIGLFPIKESLKAPYVHPMADSLPVIDIQNVPKNDEPINVTQNSKLPNPPIGFMPVNNIPPYRLSNEVQNPMEFAPTAPPCY